MTSYLKSFMSDLVHVITVYLPFVFLAIQPLMGGLHTVDAYTFVEYNTHMASGITESNMKIFNISEEYVRSSHYNLRTFLLILSTMALLKHPDKIITRMLFDYKVSKFYAPM